MGRSQLFTAACAALTIGLAAAGAARAETTGANALDTAGTVSPAAQAVADIHTAAGLADWGRRARSPLALIEAAHILATTGGQARPVDKTTEGGPAPVDGAAKPAAPALTVASLLGEARFMAGPDQALQQRIDQVASIQGKGRVGGPGNTETNVYPGVSDVYHISFRGGEEARIALKGDGDTDLSLFVYDQNGNAICADTDDDDLKYCRWTPAWSGSFTIKIHNDGHVYNHYVMATD